MSKIAVSVSTILLFVCSFASAQTCALSGKEAWNPSLHNIIAECQEKFDSPDMRFAVRITSEGSLTLWARLEQEKLRWEGVKLEPPAMISWSPNSTAFFLNDGEGSGMSSLFRLFRLIKNRVVEDKSIERAAVSLYRQRTHCGSGTADPNVWGFGWDSHGGNILLLVQPTVNEPCGKPEDFISVLVRESDGTIVKTLSKGETKARFGSLLPSIMFLK